VRPSSLLTLSVLVWCACVAATFALAGILFAAVPGIVTEVWQVGVPTNIALALGMGVLIGYSRKWAYLPAIAAIGVLELLAGLDFLGVITGSDLPGIAYFDVVAFFVALIGMLVLLIVAAPIGAWFRWCGRRRRAHG
jgi:hypothetical protein